MRVLLLTPTLGVGGAELLTITWAADLKKRGHTAAVAYGRWDARLPLLHRHEIETFRVCDRQPALESLLEWRRAVRGVIDCFRPDVIHAQSITTALIATLAGPRLPMLVTVHGIEEGDQGLAALILRGTGARVTAVSEASARGIRRRLLAPPVEVLAPGIDPDAIVEAATAPIVDRSSGTPRYCCVARHDPAKGVDVLIRAFSDVCSALPEATLTLVGGGDELESNRRLATRLGLDDSIRFVGVVSNAAPYIHQAHVTVLPSRREGLPLVALESLALGRPLVATAVGGTPSVVRDGQTGWLVPPEDPVALATAMIEAGQDAREARDRGDRGRAVVRESFTSAKPLDRIEGLLGGLAEEGPKRYLRRSMCLRLPEPVRRRHWLRRRPARRPRLLIAITLAETGGAQTYVALLLPSLVVHFDVTVAAHGPGPVREAARAAGACFVPLRHVRRPINPLRDLLGMLELTLLLLRERPDIVHANSSKIGLLGRLTAFVTRVPVRIFTAHGWAFAAHSGVVSSAYLWVERLMQPLTTIVICPAEAEKALGVRVGACAAQRTVVIPNAVDVRAALRSRSETEPALVVSIGRLQSPKDFLTFARACERVKRKDFRAIIVGEGPDRPQIEAELRRLGLDAMILLAGQRHDVRSILAEAQIFALATRSECFPMSILEAMASGLPVVASSVGGVAEAVIHGETGLLVPPGDPVALADALALLLGDPVLRNRMGAAGRARVERLFDLPAFRERHLKVYADELARVGRPLAFCAPQTVSADSGASAASGTADSSPGN